MGQLGFLPQMSHLQKVSCSLCRSYQQSLDVLERAKRRNVSWPQPKQYTGNFDLDLPISDMPTTLDEAFNGLLRTLSKSSNQCKSYYSGCDRQDACDRLHCKRYHTSAYRTATASLPKEASKSVQIDLQSGNYMVTAGNCDTGVQETHVLHIQHGQTVNMNFVV